MSVMRGRLGQPGAALLSSGLILALMVCLGISQGTTSLPWGYWFSWPGASAPSAAEGLTARLILWELRAPRTVAAGVVGIGLAVAGAVYQALFRNVLADPYILGASGGATTGLTLTLWLVGPLRWWGLWLPGIAAFGGAWGAVALVYLVAYVNRWPSSVMLLFGVVLSMMLGSVVWIVLAFADEQLSSVVSVLMGGFQGVRWPGVGLVLVLNLLGLGWFWWQGRALDALSLGDDEAQSLGLSLRRQSFGLLLISSVMIGGSVALAGSIGFIGLMAPQAARQWVGVAHRAMLPVAAALGGALLILSDTIARSLVPPLELPVGVVTALLGGPLFLLSLRRLFHTTGGHP